MAMIAMSFRMPADEAATLTLYAAEARLTKTAVLRIYIRSLAEALPQLQANAARVRAAPTQVKEERRRMRRPIQRVVSGSSG